MQPDEGIVSALEALGFPRVRCEKAAVMTGNASVDEAASWLLNHLEDAGERSAGMTRCRRCKHAYVWV